MINFLLLNVESNYTISNIEGIRLEGQQGCSGANGLMKAHAGEDLSAEDAAHCNEQPLQTGIQSIEIGMRLLQALIDHALDDQPPMLKTIALDAGLPPAKAHRYMVSLMRAGLVERDTTSGRYRLGAMARLMGLRALQSIEVVRLAGGDLPQISATLGFTVALAVWTHSGPSIIAVEERRRAITIGTRIGELMPLVNSVTGHVFGAWLPALTTAPLVEANLLTLRAAKRKNPALDLPTTRAEVDQIFHAVREAGVATTRGILNPILNPVVSAASAPIFDHRGVLAAALSILGPADELSVRPSDEIPLRLKGIAADLSERLGYSSRLHLLGTQSPQLR
jgi:DNA-binding IclR family transcriptional regulator